MTKILYRKEPAGVHPPLNSPSYRSTALRHPKQAPLAVPPASTELSAPSFDTSIYYPRHDDRPNRPTVSRWASALSSPAACSMKTATRWPAP